MSVNNITQVKIRMYCLGTGDCFILKFCEEETEVFTMMIDCGSCQGGPAEFKPYLEDLAAYVKNKIDLLVVTHEHNDHVNGFAKCENIFKAFEISEAWFAWTENPEDPNGAAKELQKKRSALKNALGNAIQAIQKDISEKDKHSNDYYAKVRYGNNTGLMAGLNTLGDINLAEGNDPGGSLPGMVKIKEIVKDKKRKTKIRYLNPGDTIEMDGCLGIRFHILGPPSDRQYIFKDGKAGVDVYNKNMAINESALAASAFLNLQSNALTDLPFSRQFTFGKKLVGNPEAEEMISKRYKQKDSEWRKIDTDWLGSAATLALRLNSHINNTSLAMAIEVDKSKKVLLFPGDAEYGSWESWYEIPKWKPKKTGEKHFVEDLLNRTVFYKVGHHLSFNGTALEKGIMKMESNELASMATLDLDRIAKGWKSTMPNKFLLSELIRRSKGKLFIMNETGINDSPSKTLDPRTLKSKYERKYFKDGSGPVYIQYSVDISNGS